MAELDVNNLVLNDISVDAITNELGTGVFDKLMEAVSKNILVQYNDSRITNSDYASVYLGSLQAVLTQSMQFVLQEQLMEVQVATAVKQLEVAEEQLLLAYTQRLLADKQAAQLGLDNVMKNSEESRNADANFVYVPNYVKVVV
jgi:hypothetical protein